MAADRVWVTVEVAGLGLLMALAVAIPVGIVSAIFRGSLLDYALRAITVVGLSVPEFMAATIVLVAPAIWFSWTPMQYQPTSAGIGGHLLSLLLPAAIIGWRMASVQARLIRTVMLEVLHQDYIRTARAKGLRESRVILGHAFRNAMIPVITLVALEVVWLISGVVIVEQIFGIPGLGSLLLQAVAERDYTTIQGLTVLIAVFVILLNIAVDVSYGWLDPRIRNS
jgi:peptide/nickel transport system permease protein